MTSSARQPPVSQAGNPVAIREVLPPPPACVLLCGMELEHVRSELVAAGYHIAQLDLERYAVPPAGDVAAWKRHVEEESVPGDREACDAIVLGDLGPAIDSLKLFTECHDRLVMQGHLLIGGATASTLNSVANERVFGPGEFLRTIARRYGFSPAPDGTGEWTSFVKDKTPRWRLRHARATDMPGIQSLFRLSFGHDLSNGLWRWKYGDGHGHEVIACRDGKVVAHYGGITRPVRYFGQPELSFSIGDIMVDPSDRAVFTRTGAFAYVAAAFPETHRFTHRTGFGFVNRLHIGIGERTGIYERIEQVAELRWPPLPDRRTLFTRLRLLAPPLTPADRKAIETLWQAMAADLREAAVGVRDAAFVEYRYFQHPDHRYDVLLLEERFTGRPLGVFVLRRHDRDIELMDLIAPLERIPALITAARRLLSRWGFAELYCWMTEHYARRFVSTGGRVTLSDSYLPLCRWIRGEPAEMMRGKWWLMAGDTDFR